MSSDILEDDKRTRFQELVWEYYRVNGRSALPWRLPAESGAIDPYHILVSELMLQQTQVSRVEPKFQQFLQAFPTIQALSQAELSEVLALWSGLGYNRRAKFLHASAKLVVNDYKGIVPRTVQELVKLPGVGVNTAAAIVAYSFNEPVVFIETNIRTVFIHHFFEDQVGVSDAQILPFVEATLDASGSRQWYWALMDYGSHLKSVVTNPSRRSKHYVIQSTFVGSRRQVRGKVLKLLISAPQNLKMLQEAINDSRLESVVSDLIKEGLISKTGSTYTLGK